MEVTDEQEDLLSEINFVPCVKFVKRGVASDKNITNEVQPNINLQVFKDIIGNATAADNDEDESNSGSDTEMNTDQNQIPVVNEQESNVAGPDEFKFEDYDRENSSDSAGLKISDVVEVAENETFNDDDASESELEDEKIKPTDNLVLVGRVDSDCSSLEVFIFNEEENSLYVHHDFLLPFHMLCIEWFSFDAGNDKPGNLCAIGGMEPVIHLYDLDIHQPLEPFMKLGRKANKKKNIKRIGHSGPVLDLSWNTNYQHILASAGVDQKCILWDLENGNPSTVLKDFAEKVQTIEFNTFEAEYLLAGCSDNTVKLFDCRQSNSEEAQYKQWIIEGEVEKVKWNPHERYNFVAGNNNGKIYYFDSRATEPIWTIDNAHEKEITDFAFNTNNSSLLTTSSVDNYLKVWKFDNSACTSIFSQHCKVGKVHCLDVCPENQWILAVGGDKRKKNFAVVNLLDYDELKNALQENEISMN